HSTLTDTGHNKAIFCLTLLAHEVITFGITLDGFEALPGVMGQQRVQAMTNREDFLGMDVDIRRLPLEAAQWLVNHHARVRQAVTLARSATGEQESTHAAGLADADGR